MTIEQDDASPKGSHHQERWIKMFYGKITIVLDKEGNGEWADRYGAGGRKTFVVRRIPDTSKFAPGRTMVGFLSGPDNANDESYTGLAFVRKGKGGNGKYEGIDVWKRMQDHVVWKRYGELLDSFLRMFDEDKEGMLEGRAMGMSVGLGGAGRDPVADGETRVDGRCTVLYSRRCRLCGRELTDPVSIRSGIGPVCAGREG